LIDRRWQYAQGAFVKRAHSIILKRLRGSAQLLGVPLQRGGGRRQHRERDWRENRGIKRRAAATIETEVVGERGEAGSRGREANGGYGELLAARHDLFVALASASEVMKLPLGPKVAANAIARIVEGRGGRFLGVETFERQKRAFDPGKFRRLTNRVNFGDGFIDPRDFPENRDAQRLR